MKNVLKKIIVVMFLCLAMAAAAGFVSVDAASKKSTDQNAAAQKAFMKKVKKLYKSYLKNDYYAFDLMYAFKDIDEDKIDELFVAKAHESGFDSTAYEVKIYKYVNGKIVDMTKKIEIYCSEMYTFNEYKYIGTVFQGDAYEECIYMRKGNYFGKVGYKFDGEETIYQTYDKSKKGLKEVSEKEYQKFVKKYLTKGDSDILPWALYEL